MAEDLPGGISKKQVAIGVAVVVVIGYAMYKRKQSQAAATPTGPGIDQSTIDPATGFVYGSPEDAAALANQANYIQPGGAYTGGGDSTPAPTVGAGFTNNGQWMQSAEDYLSNTVGLDSATVSAALGHYLAGTPLTSTEQGIVQQAIGAEGLPPVGGTNGYPPSIRTAPAVPTPAKPPVPQHTYTIVRGDTIAKIAYKVYGSSRAVNENSLRVQNPWLVNYGTGAALPAGKVITIPVPHG